MKQKNNKNDELGICQIRQYFSIHEMFCTEYSYSDNKWKQVRQQDAYLAIRAAYPRGCCPRAAKRIKKLHALLVSLYFSGR